MSAVVEVLQGDGPIVLGQPHGGTHVPAPIMARLNANGQGLADADWHIARLYEGLLPSTTVVRANVHRYVIDANRDPSGASLYPGKNTTTLVPLTDFDGRAIWRDGQAPSADEIAGRRAAYHAPYHAAVQAALARAKDRHGIAILFDCHSIRSTIPYLFEGVLPVFNTGTDGGRTCAQVIEAAVHGVARQSGQSHVLNGRFKGGWTTRHYGRPDTGVHAIQMEIAQRAYMHEAAPWRWDGPRAAALRPHLKTMLDTLNTLALSGALTEGKD
ncbi:N-formylglutamate deformylase [Shimia sp. SDUM112013]|uniref:N-formylglutamate deformylase n=1 Tax=Shimia sp. SDUM112013 TaxID=3136160 RepID=UPI0032EC2479